MAITVLGSANADLYVEIERLPEPGETLSGHHAAVRPGGKGANQAAAAARLGCATTFVGQVGGDSNADLLRQSLAVRGVGLEHLAQVDGPSGQAIIMLQSGGENSIILVAGANRAWSRPSHAAVEAIAASQALLLQREVPESVNLAAATAAHRAGVPVIFDAGGDDAPLADELLALLTVVSPNETELARLTGMPTDDDDQVLAAARALQGRGVGEVLVKLGARGSLLIPINGDPIRQGVFPVAVVDTTGAGDCFTAAYAVAMIEGQEPVDRLRFAAAAGACCVSAIGALPSMPDRATVLALISAA